MRFLYLSTLLLFITTVCFAQPITFGNGNDGNKTVSATEIVNKYFKVTSIISNARVIVQGQDTIKQNDVVLLIQMEGVNAGNWEFLRVWDRKGDTIRFANSYQKTYSAASALQLIRVPQFNDLDILQNATVTCPAWNGNVGGVLSFLVVGKLEFKGRISANGKGYQAVNGGLAGAGGAGGAAGLAGYIGGVGGNNGTVAFTGVGRGGDGGLYGDNGSNGVLPSNICPGCGDTAKNLSIINVGYNDRKLRLGASGKSVAGGNGGGGAGGGGGGAHGIANGTIGTIGGSGGGGGNGGNGGNGGGIIIFQVRDFWGSSMAKISVNGDSAILGNDGEAGMNGGNGGLGGGSCTNGGGGGGGRGANGGDGGKGGSGGAAGVINYMIGLNQNGISQNLFSVVGGKKAKGGRGGIGGSGGVNGGLIFEDTCVIGPGGAGLPIVCGVNVPIECRFDSAMIQFRRLALSCPQNTFDTIRENLLLFECNGDSVYLYSMDSFTVTLFSIHNNYGYYAVITDETFVSSPLGALLKWHDTGSVIWSSNDSIGIINGSPNFLSKCLDFTERMNAPNGDSGSDGDDGNDGGGGAVATSDNCGFINFQDPWMSGGYFCGIDNFSGTPHNWLTELISYNPGLYFELIYEDADLSFLVEEYDTSYYANEISTDFSVLVINSNGCSNVVSRSAYIINPNTSLYFNTIELSEIVCPGNDSGGVIIRRANWPCEPPVFTVELFDINNGDYFLYENIEVEKAINDFPEGLYRIVISWLSYDELNLLVYEDTFYFNVQHNYKHEISTNTVSNCKNPFAYVNSTNGVGTLYYEWSDPFLSWGVVTSYDTLFTTGTGYHINFFNHEYDVKVIDSNGCEARAFTDIIDKELIVKVIDTKVCKGTGIAFYGTNYSTAGTYSETRFGNYCDSIVTLNLSILPADTTYQTIQICPNEVTIIDNQTIAGAGVYNFYYTNESGCDSLLKLTVDYHNQVSVFVDNVGICPGGSFSFRDSVFIGAGYYTYYNGCDTSFDINLFEQVLYGDEVEVFMCPGDIIEIGNEIIEEPGYYDITLQSPEGCDSVVSFYVRYTPVAEVNLDTFFVCNPKQSFNFRGKIYDFEGEKSYITQNEFTCDTVYNFYLEWGDLYGEVDVNLCAGDTFRLGNMVVTSDTSFEYIWRTTDGCDSTVNYDFIFDDYIRVNSYVELCSGRYYNFYGTRYDEAGSYEHIIGAPEVCDTLLTLHLSFTNYLTLSKYFDLCEGDSLRINNKITVKSQGVYVDTVKRVNLCDTIYIYNVTLRQNPNVILPDTVIGCCEEKQVNISSTFNLRNINWSTGDNGASILLTAGTNSNQMIKVNFDDNYGCKGSDSLVFLYRCLQTELPLVSVSPDTVFIFHPENYQDTARIQANTSYSSDLHYSWTDDSGVSYLSQSQLTVAPKITTTFSLMVIDTVLGCFERTSIELIVIEPGYIAIPNVFSPNGDNLNDVFFPVLFGTAKAKVQSFKIFNQLGQLLHNQALPWDGKFDGNIQPSGNYYFTLEVELPKRDLSGIYIIKKDGAFALTR